MIELRTLGALALSGTNGSKVHTAYSRPKSLALLVYLALARPRGFHAQDSLLALFWPESDTARAQSSLRQSLHVLRSALGEGVVLRRGRAELGLHAEAICCDVVAFEDAIARADFEGALSIYSGELLPGFHVPDASEFERWLSAERARLHTCAVTAGRALVVQCDSVENFAQAARWSKYLFELEPLDEGLCLAAMQRLAAVGEGGAATQLYADLESRLRVDGDAPCAALHDCAMGLRVRPVTLPRTSDVFNAPTAGIRSRFSLRPRQPMRSFAVATAALVAVLVGFALLPRVGAANTAAGLAAKRVAVLPFVIRGTSSIAFLSEGMVDLLSAKLDGAGSITTVDPRSVLQHEHAQALPKDDVAAARIFARQFNASQFVLGSVIEAGGRIAITAALYDSVGRRIVSIERSALNESQLLPTIDALARELVAAEFPARQDRLQRIAASTTMSLSALKAFLDGERAVRAGQVNAAVDAFALAVREDSTFTLAHYRLSTAALWSTNSALIRRSIDLSMRYADRLPQHERLELEARLMVRNGAAEDADRAYRRIVAAYPEDVDAWTQLGELLFHTGPWRGSAIAEARPAFEQVLAQLPGDVNAILHLARIAMLENRAGDVSTLVSRALDARPDRETILELQALRVAATNDRAARTMLVDSLRISRGSVTEEEAHLIAWRVATYADSPSDGLALATPLMDTRNSARVQLFGHATRAHMHAALAKWADVDRDLAAVEKIDATYAAEMRANFALMLPSVFAPEVRRQTRLVLTRAAAATVSDTLYQGENRRDDMRRSRQYYLSGTLALAANDVGGIQQAARALGVLARSRTIESELAHHFLYELQARQLAARGDTAAALRKVEQGWPRGTPSAALPLFQGDRYTQAHERFFRAQLLVALGRHAEARGWLASVVDDQGASLMLSTRVRALAHKMANIGR